MLTEDLEAVREHFKEPKDLLRWRRDTMSHGDNVGCSLFEGVLHIAFATLNLDVLKHLFAVGPVVFMQLMGMKSAASMPLLHHLQAVLQ